MPRGVVQWFDVDAGEGRILHAGRRYAVASSDIEPAARVAGARVHFDVDGPDARAVTLRHGTRVSRTQRRFGDLTGARRDDAKGNTPFASPQPELGRDLQRHPLQVVEHWADQLAAADLAQAMLLYGPKAVLHAGGEVHVGHAEIQGFWETSPLLGADADREISGIDGRVELRWAPTGHESIVSLFLVAHGEILEQHLATVLAREPAAEAPPLPAALEVSTAGPVEDAARAYAIDKITRVLAQSDAPVLHAAIRLVRAKDPARERPAVAKVIADLDGQPVRAQVRATSMTEAIDLLDARLRDRLEHLAAHRRALRHRGPATGPGEWRHGDEPARRPDRYIRPREEREIVRHKTFEPDEVTLDEAVFDLEAMDQDFCLFHDLASGQDAVVHRRSGGHYAVEYLHGPDPDATSVPSATAVETIHQSAPVLTLAEARERLDAGGEPFVFFEDADTGRGHVLYRRYDGHYGLLLPVDEDVVDVRDGVTSTSPDATSVR